MREQNAHDSWPGNLVYFIQISEGCKWRTDPGFAVFPHDFISARDRDLSVELLIELYRLNSTLHHTTHHIVYASVSDSDCDYRLCALFGSLAVEPQ